jgi:hypothetical protein
MQKEMAGRGSGTYIERSVSNDTIRAPALRTWQQWQFPKGHHTSALKETRPCQKTKIETSDHAFIA